MKKRKILFIIWAIIVLVIIVLLTVMGFILENKYEKYKLLEKDLEEVADKYAHDKLLVDEEEIIVPLSLLQELDYISEVKVNDDVCNGYIIIRSDGEFYYEAYITCQEYTTRGYDKEKIKNE